MSSGQRVGVILIVWALGLPWVLYAGWGKAAPTQRSHMSMWDQTPPASICDTRLVLKEAAPPWGPSRQQPAGLRFGSVLAIGLSVALVGVVIALWPPRRGPQERQPQVSAGAAGSG